MNYDPKKIITEFRELMVEIQKTVPAEYNAFIEEKEAILKEGELSVKTKKLLLLVVSVSQKCPVCISKAVKHCLDAGWSRKELLEACLVAVLVGGSSVMTFVTLVDKAIQDLEK